MQCTGAGKRTLGRFVAPAARRSGAFKDKPQIRWHPCSLRDDFFTLSPGVESPFVRSVSEKRSAPRVCETLEIEIGTQVGQ